jgi:hypothetical protein
MSVDGTSNCNADTLAGNLFNNLTVGTDFTLPAVDLSGAEFQAPASLNNPLYETFNRLTESDLTSRTVGGTGLFDGLMETVSAHLKGEFDKGRITGSEYSAAYIALTQTAMGNAVQYLLNREQSYWQAQVAQKQAQGAEIELVTQRVNLEIAKANLAGTRKQADLIAAQYALAKLQLSTEDARYCQIQAQTEQLTAQTAQVTYTTTNLLPAQLGQTTAQTAQITKETDKSTYELTYILPAQLDRLTSETARLDYEVLSLLPAELARTNKQIDNITADISLSTANKDGILYNTANILPAQKAGIEADTSVKNYQLTTQLPAQVAGVTEDTRGKAYNVDFILPAQLELLREQMEARRADTMDTRSDGITPVTGSIGKQKELQEQQVNSYKRDSEQKVAKMLLDTWTVQKSMDEGLTAPISLRDPNIDSVMDHIRTQLSMPAQVTPAP